MDYYILQLEEYCDKCPEFDVAVKEVERPISFDEFFKDPTVSEVINIRRIITCSHQKRCGNMVNWLKKKLEKEKTDDCKEN